MRSAIAVMEYWSIGQERVRAMLLCIFAMKWRQPMSYLTEVMKTHLESEGIRPEIIPGFVRDLSNTICLDPHISLKELNIKLHLLGWDDFELDDYTLQLVIASVEEEDFTRQSALRAQGSEPHYY